MFKHIKNIFYKQGEPCDKKIKEQNDIVKLMYLIDRPQPTDFFIQVRRMSGMFLQERMNRLKEKEWQKGPHWIKAEWTYPCFEHLTFAYRNQIFCILIDIQDQENNRSFLPQKDKDNLIKNCIENNLIPCLFKVTVQNPYEPRYNTIKPLSEGWNLYNAITNEEVIPENLITDEKIEMSKWELNDFAIQIVRNHIQNDLKYKILSYQNIVEIDPQIWFEDNLGNKNYVVVRNTIYPKNRAEKPENINSIQITCVGHQGYFASVALHTQEGTNPYKIHRGEGAYIAFSGLEKL